MNQTQTSNLLDRLIQQTRETAAIASVEELLHWDQRTLMPPGAAEYRAEQLTILSGLIHSRTTDSERGKWITDLYQAGESAFGVDDWVTVRELYCEYEKESKVPQRLVEELAREKAHAHEKWVEARAGNCFGDFSPNLTRIIQLVRERIECVGYDDHPYDAALDVFEPNIKSRYVTDVFAGLRNELVQLIQKIQGSGTPPDGSIIEREFPIPLQEEFGIQAAKAIGFDFNAGRLDVTHHPFCCTVGPNDCRITTRYHLNHFNSAFFGILHEAGHGLYEQGLRKEFFGLPPGEYCSLGIHESQSRLWENLVGRSKPFWEHFFPLAKAQFPSLSDVSLDQFFGAINLVEPSLIRVEADEATYSLHVIIRFELEQELLGGQLSVDDLPDAWNQKYGEYLGVTSPTDSDGVLQDVHWSEALFGYFPTYALGNLFAAQLFATAENQIDGLDRQIAGGDFHSLLDWLKKNVHEKGKSQSALDIVENATGQPLSHRFLIENLESKFAEVYRL